jgi:hypothetical protein
MSKNIIFASIIITSLLITIFSTTNSFAEPIDYQTEIIPINNSIGIDESIIQMNIPADNRLPWGFVEGTIQNHVSDYPVIIQIFDNDEYVTGNNRGAVHFAQIPVNEDGSYEYKFRVLNSSEEQFEPIFNGSYTVKIFKVVYLHSNLNAV